VTGAHQVDEAPTHFVPMPDTLQSSPASAVLDPRVDPENDIAMEMVQPDPSAAPAPPVTDVAGDAGAAHAAAADAGVAEAGVAEAGVAEAGVAHAGGLPEAGTVDARAIGARTEAAAEADASEPERRTGT
jgi:hypothetical protein